MTVSLSVNILILCPCTYKKTCVNRVHAPMNIQLSLALSLVPVIIIIVSVDLAIISWDNL